MDPVQETLEQVDRLVRIDWAEVAEDIRRVVEATQKVAEVKPAVSALAPKGNFSWWYMATMEEFVNNPTKVPSGVPNVGKEDNALWIAMKQGVERLAMLPSWQKGERLSKDHQEWLKTLLVQAGRSRYHRENSMPVMYLLRGFGSGRCASAFSVLEEAGLSHKEIFEALAELEINHFRRSYFWEWAVSRLVYTALEDGLRGKAWALALCYAQRALNKLWPMGDPNISQKTEAFCEAMEILGIGVADVESVLDWKEAIEEAVRSDVTVAEMEDSQAFLVWSVMSQAGAATIWNSVLLGLALARYPRMRRLWEMAAIENLRTYDGVEQSEAGFTVIWSLTSPVMCQGLRDYNQDIDVASVIEKGRLGRYLENLEEEIRGVRGMFIERNHAPAETPEAPAVEEVAPTTEQPPLISYLTEHQVFNELNPKWYSYVLRESFPFSEIQKFETLMALKAKKEGV